MLKQFSRADKITDVAVRWWGAWILLSGAYTWLASRMTFLGTLNWAELAGVGIAAALMTLLAITASLALFRVFRPIAPYQSSVDDRVDAGNESDIAEIKEWSRSISEFSTTTSERLDNQLNQIAAHAVDIATLKDESDKRFRKIEMSIVAAGHREFMLSWASEIEIDAESLFLSGCKTPLTDKAAWAAWENRHSHWQGRIEDWLLLAQVYRLNVRNDVNRTPDALYETSRWKFSDSDFLDSNAVRKYKTFCMIQGNWDGLKDAVHNAARRVAFEGETPAALN